MSSNNRTLKVTIKKEFFDAIYRGEKKEEYRDFSKFWISRLLLDYDQPDKCAVREYDTILFRNGYNPDSPTMEVEYKGLFIDTYADAKDNAADIDRFYFSIQLGKVIRIENYQ